MKVVTRASVLQIALAVIPLLTYTVASTTNGISPRTSNYYWGHFKNQGGKNDSKISVIIVTTETQPVPYFMESPRFININGTLTSTLYTRIRIPDTLIVAAHTAQHKGIHLIIHSERVTLIGQTISLLSSDTFLVLPTTSTNTAVTCGSPTQYIYYGISTSRTQSGLPLSYTSMVLIVGTEDNIQLKLTVPQSVTVRVGTVTTELIPHREYSFTINNLQTVLVESLEDLTGTKIVTNNEVSVMSGHQAVNTPYSLNFTDHLIEQLPSTEYWGKEFYIVPLFRRSYTIKVLAAYNLTNVTIYCNGMVDHYTINEGQFMTKTLMPQEYCAVISSRKVLVVQFSNGKSNNFAQVTTTGDPMMTLVPATIQYLNQFHFSTIISSVNYSHYVNIIVLEQYFQPNMIFLRTESSNTAMESQEWVPIVINNITKAYATQVAASKGTVHITHANSSALMTAIAYGFAQNASYGHPGGLNLTKLVVQPVIKTPVNDTAIEINEGTSITLTCEAIGDPIPTLMWIRTTEGLSNRVSMDNRAVLTENDSVSVNLTIHNATREDTGEYVCTANNCVCRSIKVTINYEPVIISDITGINKNVSNLTTFICQAEGQPIPNISWYFNDVMINNSSKYMIVSNSLNTTTTENTLTLYNITSADVGVYTCTATNVAGSDIINGCLAGMEYQLCGLQMDCVSFRNSSHLSEDCVSGCFCINDYVLEDGKCVDPTMCPVHPDITNIIVTDNIIEGNNITITCEATGIPLPTIVWTFSGRELMSDSVNTTTGNGDVLRVTETLTIMNVSREHTGVYTCSANNSVGSDNSYITITVQYQPEIIDDVTDHDVIENETNSVTFTCEAIGEPSPTISWYFSDVMIITTDKYNISAAGVSGRVKSSLTIINPGTADAGTYTCHTKNVVGSENSSRILTVNAQPFIKSPLHNTTIVIHEGMNRIFTCEATGYPIPNVTWHRVDGPSIDGVSMSENILTGDGSVITNLTITNASREDTGEYTCTANNSIGSDSRIIRIVAVSIKVSSVNNTVMSGQTFTFVCTPSDDDVELYWTYQTDDSDGTVTSTNISQSKYMTQSSLFHHLILQIATVNDTGNYTCIVRGSSDNKVTVSQTILLTVLPACGDLDRLSHGILWPITRANEMAEILCSDINPSFIFGPTATRRCREDATWSRVDTSQCTISPTQQITIVMYSTYVDVVTVNNSEVITSPEIDKIRMSYDNIPSISTEQRVLPDRLYVQTDTDSNITKRQTSSIQYSILAPVVFIANVMNRTLVESVTHDFRSINDSNRNETIEFTAVDVCKCVSNSEDLLQSSTVDICVGTSVNPCVCNDTGCRCNEEGYAGNDTLCARDSDRDNFPDVELNCDDSTCSMDDCPLIAGEGGKPCQPPVTDGCPEETDPDYGIAWPSTTVNTNATNNCPNATGIATRLCNSNRTWSVPVVTNCSSHEYRQLLKLVERVEHAEGAEMAAELNRLTFQLAMASNRTDENASSYPADLMTANSLLKFSLDTIDSYSDILNSDQTVENITDCFSNILSPVNIPGWTQLKKTNESQMLLNNSERFGILLTETVEIGSSKTIESENIAIVAELVDLNNLTGVHFPDPNGSLSLNNSLFIPGSYIQQRSSETDADNVPVVNIYYENLEVILPNVPSQPVSGVLSSQVTKETGTSSDTAVRLRFEYPELVDSDNPAVVCAFWNFSLNEGSGGWDTEGVTVVMIDPINSTITCNSTHLTSFAVIVDVSGGHQDITSGESTALSIVSYIGCGISIACLLVTIVVLVLYRNTMFQGIHNFVHLNLAIALLLALITFVSGSETATGNETACTIVAALLHYFFTAVFTWMLCEGIMLYFLLVKIFSNDLGDRKLLYIAIGWGIPVPIVAISAGVVHDQYGHDKFCWIDTDEGAIWGFVAPMLAIIIVNVIFLLLSLHSLYLSRKNKVQFEKATQANIVKVLLKAAIILLPLLGTTWVFGLLVVNQESSVFAWIFTVLNSLQGMFIFFFHVIRNEKAWEKLSSCWKNKDKYGFIPTALRDSTANRSANIKGTIQTDSTNISSPSKSYGSDTIELRPKCDTLESISVGGEPHKSYGFEGAVAETDNEKPPITDDNIQPQEERVISTTISGEVTVEVEAPSGEETHM